MAKASKQSSNKISFGKRKTGKAKKTSGPKDKPTKKYKGQGRQNCVVTYFNLNRDALFVK